MAPLRFAAEANQALLRHPMNPVSYTPMGRAMAASLEIFEANTRDYQKPAFGLHATTIDGEDVAVHEEVVSRLPFGQLKRFVRAGDEEDTQRAGHTQGDGDVYADGHQGDQAHDKQDCDIGFEHVSDSLFVARQG